MQWANWLTVIKHHTNISVNFISQRFSCIFTIRGQIGGVKTDDILQLRRLIYVG